MYFRYDEIGYAKTTEKNESNKINIEYIFTMYNDNIKLLCFMVNSEHLFISFNIHTIYYRLDLLNLFVYRK